jgi:hypothetical protein
MAEDEKPLRTAQVRGFSLFRPDERRFGVVASYAFVLLNDPAHSFDRLFGFFLQLTRVL